MGKEKTLKSEYFAVNGWRDGEFLTISLNNIFTGSTVNQDQVKGDKKSMKHSQAGSQHNQYKKVDGEAQEVRKSSTVHG